MLLDPFDVESDSEESTSGEELRQNTKGNAGSKYSKMPSNPFRKTLASQTEGIGPIVLNEKQESQVSTENIVKTKPHYDVDDFKRLLLTGEKNASHASVINTSLVHDSSSNTDTSSISRYSIFEPLPENNQDTPRTSHEVTASEDEQQELRHSLSNGVDQLVPSIPRLNHEKPVTQNFPRAVLFEDITFRGPGVSSDNSEIPDSQSPKPTSPQGSTDLDKPLPPPPTSEPVDTPSLVFEQLAPDAHLGNTLSDVFQSNISSNVSIRSPPALPIARRRSQLRPKSLVANPERIISTTTDEPSAPEPHYASLHSLSPKLPPPPPPRRNNRARGLSTSSTSSAISASSTPFTPSPNDHSNLKTSISKPPLPPARAPSISSIKGPSRLTTNPGSPSMPPPPAPPPRGSGSSKSSLTLLQPSREPHMLNEDHHEKDFGASLTVSTLAPTSEEGFMKKDVLADLSALQKEVDELRGKFND